MRSYGLGYQTLCKDCHNVASNKNAKLRRRDASKTNQSINYKKLKGLTLDLWRALERFTYVENHMTLEDFELRAKLKERVRGLNETDNRESNN